jgi:signal transduction histidine kinase
VAATTIETASMERLGRERRWRPADALTLDVIVSFVLVSLFAGLVVAASVYYIRSDRGQADSFAARGYVVDAGLASRRYWHEREAMNEYFLRPGPHLLAEVSAQSAGVAEALAGIAVGSSYERSLLEDAQAANREFKIAFLRDRRAAGTAITPELLADMDGRAQALLRPLNALARENATEVQVTQRVASRATARMHLFVGLALLMFALTIVFWAIRAGQLVRRIAAQNRELKLLDSLKDDFVASVSHELRTPLTSIRGYIELLLDQESGPLNETQRTFLTVVERNTERQMKLVADLLLVAQIGTDNDLQLALERVEVGTLVEEAIEAARPTAEAKGIALDFATDNKSASVFGDAAKLAQVMDNLIANAIKFTPEGCVRVRLSSDANEAVIDVIDTGIGIPPHEQARLFERFFRTTAANTNAIQGTGLGLSIARAITNAHGGAIKLNNSSSQGTIFRLTLPLAP